MLLRMYKRDLIRCAVSFMGSRVRATPAPAEKHDGFWTSTIQDHRRFF